MDAWFRTIGTFEVIMDGKVRDEKRALVICLRIMEWIFGLEWMEEFDGFSSKQS